MFNNFFCFQADVYPRCEDCGKNFASASHLVIHRRKQHPTQEEEDREEEALRREECPECGRSVRDLERHRLNVHTPAKTEAAARSVETAVPFFGKSTVFSFDFLFRLQEAVPHCLRRAHLREGVRHGVRRPVPL